MEKHFGTLCNAERDIELPSTTGLFFASNGGRGIWLSGSSDVGGGNDHMWCECHLLHIADDTDRQ